MASITSFFTVAARRPACQGNAAATLRETANGFTDAAPMSQERAPGNTEPRSPAKGTLCSDQAPRKEHAAAPSSRKRRRVCPSEPLPSASIAMTTSCDASGSRDNKVGADESTAVKSALVSQSAIVAICDVGTSTSTGVPVLRCEYNSDVQTATEKAAASKAVVHVAYEEFLKAYVEDNGNGVPPDSNGQLHGASSRRASHAGEDMLPSLPVHSPAITSSSAQLQSAILQACTTPMLPDVLPSMAIHSSAVTLLVESQLPVPSGLRAVTVQADVHRSADETSPQRPALRHSSSKHATDTLANCCLTSCNNGVCQAELSIDVVQTDAASVPSFSNPRTTTRSKRLQLSNACSVPDTNVRPDIATGDSRQSKKQVGRGGTDGATDISEASRATSRPSPSAADANIVAPESRGAATLSCTVSAIPSEQTLPEVLCRATKRSKVVSSASSTEVASAASHQAVPAAASISAEDMPSSSKRPRRGAAVKAASAIAHGFAEEAAAAKQTNGKHVNAKTAIVPAESKLDSPGTTGVSLTPLFVNGKTTQLLTVVVSMSPRVSAMPTPLAASVAASSSCRAPVASTASLTSGAAAVTARSLAEGVVRGDSNPRKAKASSAQGVAMEFPSERWHVSHVQQLDKAQCRNLSVSDVAMLKLRPEVPLVAVKSSYDTREWKHLLEQLSCAPPCAKLCQIINQAPGFTLEEVKEMLANTVSKAPGFAINRTYKRLCARIGKFLPGKDEDNGKSVVVAVDGSATRLTPATALGSGSGDGALASSAGDETWTEKYRPLKSEELQGSAAAIAELKQWLLAWHAAMTPDMGTPAADHRVRPKSKQMQQESSKSYRDDSDTNASDSCDSTGKYLCNMALITGPTGCGKTAAVHALAAELGFKVFELNPSSLRTYKHVLDQLQEVTQSHHFDSSSAGGPGCTPEHLFNHIASPSSRASAPGGGVKKPAQSASILSFFGGKQPPKPKIQSAEQKSSGERDVEAQCSKPERRSGKPLTMAAVSGREEQIVAIHIDACDEPVVATSVQASGKDMSASRSTARGRRSRGAVEQAERHNSNPVDQSSTADCSAAALDAVAPCDAVASKAHHRSCRTKAEDQQPAPCTDKPTALDDTESATQLNRKQATAVFDKSVMRQQLNSSAAVSSSLTSYSLVLFDEADVVFEEDRGFWSAIQALLKDTKKPVIMTAASVSALSAQALVQDYMHIKMEYPAACHLASYLASVCAVENASVAFEDLIRLVDDCRNDIRRSMLQLQYLVQSGSVACRKVEKTDVQSAGHSESDQAVKSCLLEHLLYSVEDYCTSPSMKSPWRSRTSDCLPLVVPSHQSATSATSSDARIECRTADDSPSTEEMATDSSPVGSTATGTECLSEWSSWKQTRLLSDLALLEPVSNSWSSQWRPLPCHGAVLSSGLADCSLSAVHGHALGDLSMTFDRRLQMDIQQYALGSLRQCTVDVAQSSCDRSSATSRNANGDAGIDFLDKSCWGNVPTATCNRLCKIAHRISSRSPLTEKDGAVAAVGSLVIGHGGLVQSRDAIGCDYLPAIRSICLSEEHRKNGAGVTDDRSRRRDSLKRGSRRFYHYAAELPEDVQQMLAKVSAELLSAAAV